jgi:hypothetical protein
MFYTFFKHSVKSLTRNAKFDLSFILRIISKLSILYVCLFAIYLGLNFEIFVDSSNPDLSPKDVINSILFYLYFIGILLLYFFQSNYSHDLISYMHLPINRNKIISYILIKSFFNFFNLGFTLFFVPFSFINVLPISGMKNFILYLTGVFLILMIVSYIALLLRNLKKFEYSIVMIPLSLIFLSFLLKAYLQISVESFSKFFFQSLLNGNFKILVPIFLILIALLMANYLFFRTGIYSLVSDDYKTSTSWIRLGSFYSGNQEILYILLEIKLIVRNRRIYGFFLMAIGFLFVFYYALLNNQYGLYYSFMIYIILSGIFGYLISQYLFSWESSYFDFLYSSNFDFLKYLKSKYIVYVFLGFVVFLLFVPLMILQKVELHLFVTALLFNSGIGYFIIFYTATYNTARIDLDRDIFFNLQGWNSIQMAAIFIIILFPILLLFTLSLFLSVNNSLLIINLLSFFSILKLNKWFRIILNKLKARKYINLEGYRK